MNSNLRLFVAIELPQVVTHLLEGVMGRLRQQRLSGVRWVRLEGIHLTLKFLGDTPESRVASIVEAMNTATEGTARIKLGVAGLGAFPSLRAPRVIWVGVQGDVELLLKLQGRLEEELGARGFARESRPFSPHLTLGRAKERLLPGALERLAKAVEGLQNLEPAELPVTTLSLMESQLTPEGAVYRRRAQAALNGGLAGHFNRDILPKV